MPRPERVLLLRSGRHLQVALGALQAHLPGCEIAVVGTGGTERAIEQAGVPPGLTFIYTLKTRFTPLAFWLSPTAVSARLWRFSRVAVLWNDPDGTGQSNVDRTALWLSPRGFLAVTPDGRVIERRCGREMVRAVRRTLKSVGTAAVLGALYLPALVLPARRRPRAVAGDRAMHTVRSVAVAALAHDRRP